MAPFEITRTIKHPYSETSDDHRHILPTPFRQPAYSAGVLPFRWVRKESAPGISNDLDLGYDQAAEPTLKFETAWVQDYNNQKVMLDAFFESVKPEESLCFFYVKETPFVHNNRSVLVGVGYVTHVSEPVEYIYGVKGGRRSLIWDRAIQHSIRPNHENGFLLPYHELLEKSREDSTLDPAQYLAYVPEDRHDEFTYASEHVTHDGAIAALLSIDASLRRIETVLEGPFESYREWIDEQLSRLWKMRGAYPGLGAALNAFGVQYGNLLAHEISPRQGESKDAWLLVDEVLSDTSSLPKGLSKSLGKTTQQKWKKLPHERRDLLKLLSRFEITSDQATRFYDPDERRKSRIECDGKDLLRNPYLLYEVDRSSLDPVSVLTIDRGVFPDETIRKKNPLPEVSSIDEPTDPRRVRALIVEVLEQASKDGSTLLPTSKTIDSVRDLPLEHPCRIDRDLLATIEADLAPTVRRANMKDGSPAYQICRLADMDVLIKNTIEKRLQGKRHSITEDWRAFIDGELNARGIPPSSDEDEQRARVEKSSALKELAEARFSVLVGPAGTGKTTLLAALCHHQQIKSGGVLLLAPTGKARVKMQQATGVNAFTIAQFLMGWDRYDAETGLYRLSMEEKASGFGTVIVDEASMLTEEQLAATIDALKGVERLILVGDPRQLPPIGSGRPFVDIIRRLVSKSKMSEFPLVRPCYAELTVRRRQKAETTEDLLLADWFSGRSLGPGDDEIFERVSKGEPLQRLRIVRWDDETEILSEIIRLLVEELKLVDEKDVIGFETSIGGSRSGDFTYFNIGSAKSVDNWQILSPVYGNASGVVQINRTIKKIFRSRAKELAEGRARKTPRPLGPEGIIYGDKVINIRNRRRHRVYPKEKSLNYVANGEIGIAVGLFRRNGMNWHGPLPLEVEFSSQLGFKYTYTGGDFKEEANPLLELAYAITIHKAQGSEFKLCIIVVPNPCYLLSRELLYTSLTRHTDKVVILNQGSPTNLKKYSSDYYSETARRLTNLFFDPEMTQVEDSFFEEGLIHRTSKGEPIRSKSEVVIADNLAAEGIEYTYEKKLLGQGGSEKYPDFTIEDSDSGMKYYWEHLGMMSNKGYRERWERKLIWYRSEHILPFEDGGGENGTLVVTRDTDEGGIDSASIIELIRKIFKQRG